MSVTIASIYPIQCHIELNPFFQPQPAYTVPAVAKRGDPPQILVVQDQLEIETQPVTGYKRNLQFSAKEVADDVVRLMTTGAPGMTPECHPGIWVCGGATPTKEEIAFIEPIQDAWLDKQIAEGDRLWTIETRRQEVIHNLLMRKSAEWRSRNRPWLQDPKDNEIKICQFCIKPINPAAIKCPECGEVVDFERYAALEAQRNKALAAAMTAQSQAPRPVAR